GDLREAWRSELIGVYDYNGKLIETIGRYDSAIREAKSYLIFPIFHIDFENELLISAQSSSFRIQLYDLNTQKRMAWFGKKTPSFKEPAEYISPYLPHHKIMEKSIGVSFPASVYSLSDYI